MTAADKVAIETLANTLGSEKNLIERIRAELDRRSWTRAELSRRMEAHAAGSSGGVIHPVVLSKLLNGDRGRHISIDQLVTLAGVFDVSVAELLLPPGAIELGEALRALSNGPQLQAALRSADAAVSQAREVVARAMVRDPDFGDRVADVLEEAVAATEKQGRELSDSIRVAFYAGCVDLYDSLKVEH